MIDIFHYETLPSFVQYYMGLTFFVSGKSHDSETQHGCIITNKKNRPLGFGYNGFKSGSNDSMIPNTRPLKYPFCIHAEDNAIQNCTSKINNGIAYVSGHCCEKCIKILIDNNITCVYMYDCHGSHVLNYDIFDEIVKDSGISVYKIQPNLKWITQQYYKIMDQHIIDKNYDKIMRKVYSYNSLVSTKMKNFIGNFLSVIDLSNVIYYDTENDEEFGSFELYILLNTKKRIEFIFNTNKTISVNVISCGNKDIKVDQFIINNTQSKQFKQLVKYII